MNTKSGRAGVMAFTHRGVGLTVHVPYTRTPARIFSASAFPIIGARMMTGEYSGGKSLEKFGRVTVAFPGSNTYGGRSECLDAVLVHGGADFDAGKSVVRLPC
jgi:hypothetical protein